jgi:hypothetical protein
MRPTPPVGARIHIDVVSTCEENIPLTTTTTTTSSSTSLAERLRRARDARESSTATTFTSASVPRTHFEDETDARTRRVNTNPNEEKFEGYIAATRAATGCDRDEAATAVALAMYRRDRRRMGTVVDDEVIIERATTLARGARELRRMGFSDVDGVASGALAACDGDVERAVEACLAVR